MTDESTGEVKIATRAEQEDTAQVKGFVATFASERKMSFPPLIT